jgi:hypothetical protein
MKSYSAAQIPGSNLYLSRYDSFAFINTQAFYNKFRAKQNEDES